MTTATCGIRLARHARLVVEDPAEVLPVGKDLGLERQERAARVDEVDAGQAVLLGDLLRAQVLLDRDRVVRAALDGGVVGDDHDFPARDPPDAGDEPGARRLAVVHPVGRQGRELEERRARVEQRVHPVAHEHLLLFARGARGPLPPRRAPSRAPRAAASTSALHRARRSPGTRRRRCRRGFELLHRDREARHAARTRSPAAVADEVDERLRAACPAGRSRGCRGPSGARCPCRE